MPLRPWHTPGAVLSNPLTHNCSDMPTQHPKLVLLTTGRHRIHSEEFLTLPPMQPYPWNSAPHPTLPSRHALAKLLKKRKGWERLRKVLSEKFYQKNLIKALILLLQTREQSPLFSFRAAKDGPCTSLKQNPTIKLHLGTKTSKSKSTRSWT